jgi:hypothetical protein
MQEAVSIGAITGYPRDRNVGNVNSHRKNAFWHSKWYSSLGDCFHDSIFRVAWNLDGNLVAVQSVKLDWQKLIACKCVHYTPVLVKGAVPQERLRCKWQRHNAFRGPSLDALGML